MSLKSRLFRNDPKLQACLVHDTAHVVKGNAGEHVAKIQMALLMLDGAAIAPGESQEQKYGSSTTEAVLAFKRKRGIINHSYQTQADNIVGKMTIAAMDRELQRREPQAPSLSGGLPRVQHSVGLTGVNAPADVHQVGMLLWAAGYGPRHAGQRRMQRLTGENLWPPPLSLSWNQVMTGLRDFLGEHRLPPATQVTQDSASLLLLFSQAATAVGAMCRQPFLSVVTDSLRQNICTTALAVSSGPCRQEFLDETGNGDLKVPVGVHWCGIYAAFIWTQAGASVNFRRGDGGGVCRKDDGSNIPPSVDFKYLNPGDILLFSPRGGRNHHAIVIDIVRNNKCYPSVVQMIEGNIGPGGPNPRTSEISISSFNFASNAEEKMFLSVDSYADRKVRYI